MRRTCPACQRRYGGLVAVDCRVCQGLGIIGLGSAALHHAPAPAVARAVELYLEQTARDAPHPTARADRVDAAILELRTAGVITAPYDGTGSPATRHPSTPPAQAERTALRLVSDLGAFPTTVTLNALRAPLIPLEDATPAGELHPQASANGDRSALAQAVDPIEPLGPNLTALAAIRYADEHTARVLAGATAHLAAKPARRKATATR